MLKATLPELRAIGGGKSGPCCATHLRPGPRPAYWVCTTLVKKGSSNGMPDFAYNPFGKPASFFTERPLFSSQKGRDERSKVSTAGLPGRQLRQAEARWAATPRWPPRTRAGCPRGRPPHLPGRTTKHQHAGLPGGRSLRAVRVRGGF